MTESRLRAILEEVLPPAAVSMKHRASSDDLEFQRRFEACETLPAAFDHAAHVRLAYVYLCEHSADAAAGRMKAVLLAFLAHLGIGQTKYHETITRAWVMAVNHFMTRSPIAYRSSSAFMRANGELLDTKIMLTFTLLSYCSHQVQGRRSFLLTFRPFRPMCVRKHQADCALHGSKASMSWRSMPRLSSHMHRSRQSRWESVLSDPPLHPTRYSGLHPLRRAGELKRQPAEGARNATA